MPEGHRRAGVAAEIASEKAAEATTMATGDVPHGSTSKNHFYASLDLLAVCFQS